MFAGARRGAAVRSGLPLYIAVGEADPVNAGLALLTPLTERYRAAGLTDVTVRTYPAARHEILNETNRDEVIVELTTWLDRVGKLPAKGWKTFASKHADQIPAIRAQIAAVAKYVATHAGK